MADLRIKLNDGTTFEVDPGAPWTAREQVDWEETFKQSFTTVFQAIGAEMRAQEAAEADPEGLQAPARHFKVTWFLWFAWHRLRPQVASRWSVFLNDQLADYDFVDRADTDDDAETEKADADVGDPTVTAEPSGQAL